MHACIIYTKYYEKRSNFETCKILGFCPIILLITPAVYASNDHILSHFYIITALSHTITIHIHNYINKVLKNTHKYPQISCSLKQYNYNQTTKSMQLSYH